MRLASLKVLIARVLPSRRPASQRYRCCQDLQQFKSITDHGAAVSIQHGQQFAFLEFSLALVERLGECFVPVPVQNEGKKELMVEGREQARIGAERIRETVPAYLAEFPGVAMRAEGLEGVGVRGDGVTNLADVLRNEDALFRRVVPMSASIQADEDQVDGGGEIGHQSM